MHATISASPLNSITDGEPWNWITFCMVAVIAIVAIVWAVRR